MLSRIIWGFSVVAAAAVVVVVVAAACDSVVDALVAARLGDAVLVAE